VKYFRKFIIIFSESEPMKNKIIIRIVNKYILDLLLKNLRPYSFKKFFIK